jgi:hypothetical protein
MAKIIKPPTPLLPRFDLSSVFLAGSIEMGTAANWQADFEREFQDIEIVLLNPRRDDWDASWGQSAEDEQFREQVQWELKGQEQANIIAMYFDPNTKSPVTLLELGLFAQSQKLIVCCPTGYWRKGNVDLVCERYEVHQVASLTNLIKAVKQRISRRG